jgi:hypothetical protein
VVREGTFGPVSHFGWAALEANRATIERTLPSVGKVNLSTGGYATGFVVADNLLLTADFAVVLAGEKLDPSVKVWVDFEDVADRPEEARARAEFDVRGIAGIDQAAHSVLLRLQPESRGGYPARSPLPLSVHPPEPVAGSEVAMIGHPSRSSGVEYQSELANRVLGDMSGVKRVQPGRILGRSERELYHDCFTLSGDAGACLLDFRTGTVIGLHLGSSPAESGGGTRRRGLAVVL